jgi:hypothetical protein
MALRHAWRWLASAHLVSGLVNGLANGLVNGLVSGLVSGRVNDLMIGLIVGSRRLVMVRSLASVAATLSPHARQRGSPGGHAHVTCV